MVASEVAKIIKINENMIGYKCIKCDTLYELTDMFEGCLQCKQTGEPSSVKPVYQDTFDRKN